MIFLIVFTILIGVLYILRSTGVMVHYRSGSLNKFMIFFVGNHLLKF